MFKDLLKTFKELFMPKGIGYPKRGKKKATKKAAPKRKRK